MAVEAVVLVGDVGPCVVVLDFGLTGLADLNLEEWIVEQGEQGLGQ